MARQKLVIVGAGGFGREVAWLVSDINEESNKFELLGFLDDYADGQETVEGHPILGRIDDWPSQLTSDVQTVCAIGDPAGRYRVVKRLQEVGASFATLVHPTVRRSRWVELGPGSILCAGTILTTNIDIGPHTILNLDCTVGHDTRIGAYGSFMPGVHISGEVSMDAGVYFGTGAVVVNKIHIGAWTIVGAGAVVTKDLPEGVVAVGTPAKPIKNNPNVPLTTEDSTNDGKEG